jgi:hypothetical protein
MGLLEQREKDRDQQEERYQIASGAAALGSRKLLEKSDAARRDVDKFISAEPKHESGDRHQRSGHAERQRRAWVNAEFAGSRRSPLPN